MLRSSSRETGPWATQVHSSFSFLREWKLGPPSTVAASLHRCHATSLRRSIIRTRARTLASSTYHHLNQRLLSAGRRQPRTPVRYSARTIRVGRFQPLLLRVVARGSADSRSRSASFQVCKSSVALLNWIPIEPALLLFDQLVNVTKPHLFLGPQAWFVSCRFG